MSDPIERKRQVAWILTVLGVVALLLQSWHEAVRERRFYEVRLQEQRESIAKGLEEKWRGFLLSEARDGRLNKDYLLTWNRTGAEMKTPYFPIHPIELDWSEYRSAVKGDAVPRIQTFLRGALRKENSWDRVLAIEAWSSRFGVLPKEIRLSEYERTLVDDEARAAYHDLFEFFSGERDFTFSRRELEFDRVFFRVTDSGDLEAFVPSSREIQKRLLPEFLRRHGLSQARLGMNPWNVYFDVITEFNAEESWPKLVVLTGALFSIAGGLWFFLSGVQLQRGELLRKITFLNQVVHELKTPLAGLKLHTQLVKKMGPSDETLDAIDSSVARLDGLFDQIVLINRPIEKVSLDVIEADELNTWMISWRAEYGERFLLREKFNQFVCSDSKRLEMILRNLISNAVKYGEHVEIAIDESGSRTRIEVRDDGPGISLKDRHRVFEEFYRAEEAKRRSVDGLGLGLALVRKLAHEIQAEVRLENPGEKGARFSLSLPREKT